MPTYPILAPAGYATLETLGFDDGTQRAAPVSRTAPLPVTTVTTEAASTPLAGTLAASGSVGPFAPTLGRAIWVSLSGSWTGSVRVLKSTDGGATRLPLTVAGESWATFAGNANEPVTVADEAGATFYLAATIASGTLTYRVAQ